MSAQFVAHVTELLAGLGQLQARPMFGGHGFYCGGKFFGFVLDDVLYFKVNAQSRPLFEGAGSLPFVYLKRTKPRPSVNYYRAPAEALESPAAALQWARLALSAAGSSPSARRARTPARRPASPRGRRRTGKA